jgi:hypothetical protein
MNSWTLTEKRNLSLPTARSTLPLQWWLAGLLPLAKGVDDAVPYHIISYQKDQFMYHRPGSINTVANQSGRVTARGQVDSLSDRPQGNREETGGQDPPGAAQHPPTALDELCDTARYRSSVGF